MSRVSRPRRGSDQREPGSQAPPDGTGQDSASDRPQTPSARWNELRRGLENRSHDELLGLLHDLFELSQGNRVFLAARLLPRAKRDELLAHCRQALARIATGSGAQAGRRVRQVLRGYLRASGDRTGAALELVRHLGLLLRDMRESGARRPAGGFGLLFGDLLRLLKDGGPGLREQLRDELSALQQLAERADGELAEWIAERLRGAGG